MSAFDLVVRGTVVTPSDILAEGYVAVRGEAIAAVGQGEAPPAARLLDYDGCFVLPGLVDGPRIRSVLRNKAAAAGISDNEQTERAMATVSLRCFVTQQDIANMALYLCSPFGATISGQAMSVDGGMEGLA